MLSPQVSEGDGVAKSHLNVPCSVTIEQDNGEWIVRVCDENAITQVKSLGLKRMPATSQKVSACA